MPSLTLYLKQELLRISHYSINLPTRFPAQAHALVQTPRRFTPFFEPS
ncbi:MAG: hypothetical protein MSG64_11695 [Pyrinomonadaceae bacterium MAG19_C2-C3]|nr:hypothetical protein [Pyrinomonadaceae bacterium MAG19_C2-C3]